MLTIESLIHTVYIHGSAIFHCVGYTLALLSHGLAWITFCMCLVDVMAPIGWRNARAEKDGANDDKPAINAEKNNPRHPGDNAPATPKNDKKNQSPEFILQYGPGNVMCRKVKKPQK